MTPGGTDPRPAYENVIQALVDHDVAFELNTAGWRKDVREQYPAFEFLRLAAWFNVNVNNHLNLFEMPSTLPLLSPVLRSNSISR